MNWEAEEFLIVDQLAQRLGWKPKTVQNKMGGKNAVFKRGIHFDSPPGMPTLFRWSAVLELYRFDGERTVPTAAAGARQPGESRRASKKIALDADVLRLYV